MAKAKWDKTGIGPVTGLEKFPTTIADISGMGGSRGNPVQALGPVDWDARAQRAGGAITKKPGMGPGSGLEKFPAVVGGPAGMGGSRGNPVADARVNALWSKMNATLGGGADMATTNVYDKSQDGAMDHTFQVPPQANKSATAALAGTKPAPTQAAAPAGKSTGYQFKPMDYDALYANVGKARKSALDAAMAGQNAALGQQQGALQGQYDALRGQAYSNARLTALGNNEGLAAQGLAGAANAGPQTGYSETSRTAQNVALQNSVNALNTQQQGAVNDIANQRQSALLNRDQQWANTQGDLAQQKIDAQTRQNEFQAGYEQENARMAEDKRRYNETTAYQKDRDKIADDQWNKDYGLRMTESQDRHTAAQLSQAWERVNTMGYVDEAASKVLGIKVGTKTAQAKQFQAQLDAQKRGGGK